MAPRSIPAIPTKYRGVMFRSRLEARWASMFDALGWHWDYEPDLQAGFVIPDFVLTGFAHAVVVECKPVLSIEELTDHRQQLIGKMPRWLRDDVTREIGELSGDPELAAEALNDLLRVARRENPVGRSRRILVVGPVLHLGESRVTIDGDHGFCVCCDHGEPKHVGLVTALHQPCLKCGEAATAWVPDEVVLAAWRESQNVAQWQA